jgi:nitroimidazol reductase NimA-like FMN-containing flavoprotein (pyridoxamine 5'-phosphate oxidase superfamily)
MDSAETPLDGDRCWAMLATGLFGRVALSVRAMPVIVPVRYRVDAAVLRVQLANTARIGDALPGSIVAFQADGFNHEAQRDWSVHAIGRIATPDMSEPKRDSATCEIHPLRIEGHWLTFDRDFF